MVLPQYRPPGRTKGYTFSVDPDGKTVERETAQCVHCGMHWEVEPGSGKLRGWCLKCNGPICGKPGCMSRCIPFEKAIEIAERRR